jgi:hypothetical protein
MLAGLLRLILRFTMSIMDSDQARKSILRFIRSTAILLLAFAALFAYSQKPPVNPVTEISADLGPCSAEFHVTDMAGNPLYNAKVHTIIRYGFLSKRKLELDAGTNADGRARFIKLPDTLKKPVEFSITNGIDTATRNFSPATDCHASFNVPLQTR